MKQFLAITICVLLTLTMSGQETQIRKGGGGAGGSATNAVATIRKDGTPIVNGATVIDFTNAPGTVVTVTADGTTARVGIPQGGIPSYVITNAESKDVLLNAGLGINGPSTNSGAARFNDEIIQPSGNSTQLGSVSILDFLVAPFSIFTGRVTNSSTSGGGFWSADSVGFISLSSPTDYLLMSQPQGGIFGTLDGWVLGEANSTKTIVSLSTNISTVESNLWIKGTNMVRQLKLTGGQAASRPAFIDSNTNIVAATGTPDGTKFLRDDGVLAVPSGSGGGGGTNFPNINLLLGNTNLVLSAGVRKSFRNDTNGSHGINLNLAVPESGYEVTYSVSNSGSSDITVTFYTNSVAANPYDIASKTNVNTFTASASAVTEARLKYVSAGRWELERVFGPTAILKFGEGTIRDTNGVNGLDIVLSTRRYTNYASASITINCATDVTANYTNAVAANNTITLATPVIGTSGSLGLVSDGSARTLAILAPVAITWLSTNDTANATNILTTASKRSLFAWRVGMGTDGVSTNIHCWVKNQTP